MPGQRRERKVKDVLDHSLPLTWSPDVTEARPPHRTFVVATGVAAATALVAAPVDAARSSGAAAQRPAAARVLASGLNNPRHLVFRGGTLYVAEAGKGGTRNVRDRPRGRHRLLRRDRLDHAARQAPPSDHHGAAVDRRPGHRRLGPRPLGHRRDGRRKLAFTIGGGGTPAHRATLPASARRIGTLVVASHRGKSWTRHTLRQVADLMRFEARTRPRRPGSRQRPDRPDPAREPLPHHRLRRQRPAPGRRRRPDPRARDRSATGRSDNPFAPGQRADAGGAHRGGGRARRALFVSELTGFPFPQGAPGSSGWSRVTRRRSGPPA